MLSFLTPIQRTCKYFVKGSGGLDMSLTELFRKCNAFIKFLKVIKYINIIQIYKIYIKIRNWKSTIYKTSTITLRFHMPAVPFTGGHTRHGTRCRTATILSAVLCCLLLPEHCHRGSNPAVDSDVSAACCLCFPLYDGRTEPRTRTPVIYLLTILRKTGVPRSHRPVAPNRYMSSRRMITYVMITGTNDTACNKVYIMMARLCCATLAAST